MARRLLIVIAVLTLIGEGYSQNCSLSGAAAWSQQVRSIIAGCNCEMPSPNKKWILRINSSGGVELYGEDHPKIVVGTVDPPAMVSWSPGSDAFFLNDGQGSGMWSLLRLFKLEAGQAKQDLGLQKNAVALFRTEKACDRSASNPAVWGFGWSADGGQVYLLVQATVNEPCGKAGSFMTLIAKVEDGSVISQLSERESKERFANLLPAEMFH